MTQAFRYIPKYSAEDYRQWEGDWELWEGIAVAMTPSPSLGHQNTGAMVVAHLVGKIKDHHGCDCRVGYETDWQIDETTVVRPDVFIACPTQHGAFLTQSPKLIVELISPSTAHKDRVAKRDLYAKQGVAYYLIVDHQEKNVEALIRQNQSYRELSAKNGKFEIELHTGCGFEIDINAFWTD